jgi:hypothetical protein
MSSQAVLSELISGRQCMVNVSIIAFTQEVVSYIQYGGFETYQRP